MNHSFRIRQGVLQGNLWHEDTDKRAQVIWVQDTRAKDIRVLLGHKHLGT